MLCPRAAGIPALFARTGVQKAKSGTRVLWFARCVDEEDIKGGPARWERVLRGASRKIPLRERASYASNSQGFGYSGRKGGKCAFRIHHGLGGRSCGKAPAGGAGSPDYGERGAHHRRKRQKGTFLRIHEDRDGPQVGRGHSTEFQHDAGAIAVPHQRTDEKRSGLSGGEVEELPQRQRLRGIGVYRTGDGILGHALPE